MNWMLWVVVGWLALTSLITIGQVGKRPATVTGAAAACLLLVNVGLIACVYYGAQALTGA
jgi:hypothetical protein